MISKLDGVWLDETPTGVQIHGWDKLGKLAREKYGLRLKSRRLLKKYAKILVRDAIENFIEAQKNANSTESY